MIKRMKKCCSWIVSRLKTTAFRHGSYSFTLSCIVIALAVIANLAVNALPQSMTNIDISSNKVYTLGDQTKEIVAALDQDITIYALFEDGYEDETLVQLLSRYEELSDHIHTEIIDPVSNPTFTSNYGDSSLETGSVIVESDDRYKTISYSEIYETSYTYDSYYDYSTTQDFDGEGEITSAIDYVTSDALPVLYYTTGHDEVSLSDTALTALTKSNYEVTALSLLSEGSIPDDCGVLMILAPQSDFSSDEADMVIEYLESGGKALILTSYTTEKLTEFERILNDYGMATSDGIIFEGDSSYYYQSPMYIIPQYGSHEITSSASSSETLALLIMASGIELTDVRSSVTLTSLLSTTESAYEKIPVNGQLDETQTEDDEEGVFQLGVLAEEETADGETTQLVVFSTYYMVEESLVSSYNISNVDLFVNSIGYMCEHTTSVTIDAKSVDIETVTPSAASVNMQALLFVILIPGFLLITGILVWMRRRKK